MNDFNDIKIGDQLILDNYHNIRLLKVSKVTNKFFWIGIYKFRKSNGYSVGKDTWTNPSVRYPTEKDYLKLKIIEMGRLLSIIERNKKKIFAQIDRKKCDELYDFFSKLIEEYLPKTKL